MSAAIGGRSGNRGLCAQPCRLQYTLDGAVGAHLSLKDLCLVEHLDALEKCGVACLKLEGRMKRPEYVAIATQIYADAIRSKQTPGEAEMKRLTDAFSRDGFTDAYLRGKKGPEMLGVRAEEDKREHRMFAEARNLYTKTELQRVPIRFYAMIEKRKPTKFAVSDDAGHVIRLEGAVPEAAIHKAITPEQIETQLSKTGGTPYLCKDVQVALEPGLSLPLSEINEMRRRLLDELTTQRGSVPVRSEGIFRPEEPGPKREDPPQLNVSLYKASQLTDEFVDLRPSLIYLPIGEILEHSKTLRPYLEREHTKFCAILPRVIWDNERDALKEQLQGIQELGISECLVGNMGHIDQVRKAGISTVRGDFGLNVFNGQTLRSLGELGFDSATVSFELNMAQIRDMDKAIDLELMAYGRLPVMLTENCSIKNAKGCQTCETKELPQSLSDRLGIAFPVRKEPGCRNVVLNSKKLFLADRDQDYMHIGLWGVRLGFTTENARECREVLERYLGLGGYEPGGYTRGLYYRGVE